MTAVALKGLLGRKLRSILTGLAIVLGVAMISGTFILTDTINKAFTNVFNVSYRHTDAIISGKQFVSESNSIPTVPASVLRRVRALPDVAAASGAYLFDTVKLVDHSGKTIASGGAPSLGFGVDPRQQRFNPITLASGHWAEGPRQVVIDTATAANKHYKVGDVISAKGDGPVRSYTVVGLGKISGVSIGGATLAIFDVPTAASILDKSGYDNISVAAKSGVSPTRLAAEIKPLLPPVAEVRTGSQQASHDATQITAGTSLVKDILLAFGGIALFVGAFVIFNTISITIAQRTRELATLRTLGASRRQVRRSVMLESFVIGFAASVVGLFAGLGLAKGLNAAFIAIGVDLPQAGTVLAGRTIIVSLLVGTLVTLAAGLSPAIRATRVPPISAVREGAVLPSSRHAHRRPWVAGAVMLLGLAVIVQALFATSGAQSVLMLLGAGTLLLFVGVALVSSYVVRPLASVVGRPARALGGAAGRLAVANSVRNTSRTAATAAALMIGLALIAFVATLGAGLRSSTKDALRTQVKADYVLTPSSTGTGSFPIQTATALAGTRGVELVSAVRSDRANVAGARTTVAGVDPATIGGVYRFAWKTGSDAVLSHLGDGAIVDSSYATKHHLRVGSTFTLQSPSGTTRRLTVAATYHPPQADPVLPTVVISQATFDSTFPTPQDAQAFVKVDGGPSAATTAELKRALGAYPDAKVQTRAAWVTAQAKSVDQVLDLFYVLLALSVIVSLFGMINTLVLAVFERTRELGMLRAIGMSRRQTRRMIRHESIVTALIGAALGLPLGVLLAALTTRALGSLGIGFHLPGQQLAAFVVLAVVAGIGAAVLPARRAARLNVLQALQYE
ncbi:MAG TPA: FtsX-like permease family protein [Solirubrobacteraceae bacterium]|nr:FtsX-like permease family protein [Solirubrobacteraceae bacterium]